MRYEIERAHGRTEIVDADGFNVQTSGGGMFLSAPSTIHYVFYRRGSGQYAVAQSIAAFSDVVAIREKPVTPVQNERIPDTEVEVIN